MQTESRKTSAADSERSTSVRCRSSRAKRGSQLCMPVAIAYAGQGLAAVDLDLVWRRECVGRENEAARELGHITAALPRLPLRLAWPAVVLPVCSHAAWLRQVTRTREVLVVVTLEAGQVWRWPI
jgi:hypothetical protein